VLEITRECGDDRYERGVVDLSVNGEDLSAAGKAAGFLRPWPHKERRALSKKA